jgi:predicted homoserine dehydrogenase-like protein
VSGTAEVVATAKRDLEPGEVIDGIGGHHVRGVTHLAQDARDLVPLGLAEGATIERPVAAGDPVPRDAVAIRPSVISHLRELQDRLFPA